MTGADTHRIRIGRGAEGVERLEAHLHGRAFAPHRHDIYAIGITIAGVQRFRFRGESWQCLPGQCHILHPDELHDGAAGDSRGFRYRIVYLDPALVREALHGAALPFVARPVLDMPDPPAGLWDLGQEVDALGRVELAVAAAGLLRLASGGRVPAERLDLACLSRVREAIAAEPAERHALEHLEGIAGLDRWTLARQFRAAFGTSPSRFRTMRQLDLVRRGLLRGGSLAGAALDAGFADQAHMSRQFKRAYGVTPGAWLTATRE